METEKILSEKDLIVSSTDNKGIINYVNGTFERISEYKKDELYGKPHNLIRHPDMPKGVFRYVWNCLLAHKPVVAYVKNYVKGNKTYYWVKAVMYPKIVNNEIHKITSYRTKAKPFEIQQIQEIYKQIVVYERGHSVDESYNYFLNILNEKNLTYDKMINRLNDNQQILNNTLLNLDVQQFKTDHMIFRSRIESLVEKGYIGIEVLKPTCCDFGKKLSLLEGPEFSNESNFIEIKRLHNKVHNELQLFVDSRTENERKSYMDVVYKDIDSLFIIMETLKNEHKHNIEVL